MQKVADLYIPQVSRKCSVLANNYSSLFLPPITYKSTKRIEGLGLVTNPANRLTGQKLENRVVTFKVSVSFRKVFGCKF
jgi:hypothetical protein